MRKLMHKAMLLGLGVAFALPSFAQGADDKAIATLEVNKGVVMTSRGGEYAAAASGQQLFSEERVMVTEGGSATVTYNDNCKRTYDKPGVYKLDDNCKAVAAFDGGARVAFIAGGIIAIGVVAHNINDNHKKPISR